MWFGNENLAEVWTANIYLYETTRNFALRWLSTIGMFKKLKQKIEEGGEGGIDKVSFSHKKFPGAIVRSPPAEAPDFPALGGEDGKEKEEESSLPSPTEAIVETAGEKENVLVSLVWCMCE